MKNHLLKLSIIVLSLFASNLFAAGPCTLADVSGTIVNNIVNPTVQSGTINLLLVSQETGDTLFEGDGGILGRVKSQVSATEAILDHIAFFDAISSLTSMDDHAFVVSVDGPRVFLTETINNFWGTGIFKNATGEIVAEGYLDFSLGTTFFELSGTVCLK